MKLVENVESFDQKVALIGSDLWVDFWIVDWRHGYDNEESKTTRLTLPTRRRAIDVVTGPLSSSPGLEYWSDRVPAPPL